MKKILLLPTMLALFGTITLALNQKNKLGIDTQSTRENLTKRDNLNAEPSKTVTGYNDLPLITNDTITNDTDPVKERTGDFITDQHYNPFDLQDPPSVEQNVEYDPTTGQYKVTEKVGDNFFRAPTYIDFDTYWDLTSKKEQDEYFRQLIRENSTPAGEDPIKPYKEKDDIKSSMVDRLFGGSGIDIRPQGNIDLTFGGDYQKIENPILPLNLQKQGGFDFDMNIQMNVVGKIGERLKLSTSYNTQSTFNVDNQIKLDFSSDDVFTEDAIIKKIEAGNVSMPLKSSLIQGSQSLFGFKTQLQFGRLTTTLLLSQQQSKRQELAVQGGSQTQNFQVNADQYDENRHFFFSHYNRNSYEPALSNLPQINSLFHITKLELWITNDRNSTDEVRDIVAFTDLGEPDVISNTDQISPNPASFRLDLRNLHLPDNGTNDLYERLRDNPAARNLNTAIQTMEGPAFGLVQSRDFSKVRARKLQASEYTFSPELGFASLNVTVQPDQVLGVSFQYTYNGRTYQVGEFAQDLPQADSLNVLYTKMLKSVNPRIDIPLWDLMMKNVYSLGAYQVNNEDFRLDIYYQDAGGGDKRFLPTGACKGKPLLEVFNLDKLNRMNDPQPDGQFDFVPGTTIFPQNGRVIFPVLEPFGSSLKKCFYDDDINDYDPSYKNYIYQQLYDSTLTAARERLELNRFIIKGSYKSAASSEINLGAFNIPKGSVTVTAGGQTLKEGTDYTIDYNVGRLKILNDAIINSGLPVKVSFEDNSLFGFQQRSMMGSRFDFYVNEHFNIGATLLRLSERPPTNKVNIGDDPINNTIMGFDVQYSRDAPWLTRLVDKLPLLSTKAPSKVSFTGEAAFLKPGHARAINQNGCGDTGGTVYLDDFEGSTARYPLGLPANNWTLASTPRNDSKNNNPMFPESKLTNDYLYGANRAKLSWYNLDPCLATGNCGTVDLGGGAPNDPFVHQFYLQDILKNFSSQTPGAGFLRTFDLAFYPEERGPYNYDVNPTPYTKGTNQNTGGLLDPKTRWGGIMRALDNNDFEATNMEFIEFWVMDPFINNASNTGGDMYIELGTISEDVLRDSRRFFENGLPTPTSNTTVDTTFWSSVPRIQPVVSAFDNDPATRPLQDVGFDGWDDEEERSVKSTFLSQMQTLLSTNPTAYNIISSDPSSDNFRFYLDEYFNGDPILERYRDYNGPDGNTPVNGTNDQFASASSTRPDDEDINKDNTLTEEENYYQYHIPIQKGTNGSLATTRYTVNTSDVEMDNGTTVTWYQIKIPIDQFTKKVGNIQDFRSIRFMRMYMNGFEQKTVLRMARFDLVRNQWRRYRRSIATADGQVLPEPVNTRFDVNAVSIEENSERTPIPYILPPCVQREQSVGPFPNAFQNEQSLSMRVVNLQDGGAKAIFKPLNLDMRVFQRLKMYVHAESIPVTDNIADGAVSCFIRLGSDFEKNYYEYEIPLKMSDANASTAETIWPQENYFDFPLELLRDAKKARNALTGNPDSYIMYDPEKPANKITVVGNPDLGLVEGAMIGIRNKADGNGGTGRSYSAEIWVNELRVTGLNERGGAAATARLDLQLADLGNMTIAGTVKSIGWGSLDQRLQQRSRERLANYDFSTTLALDKFLPKKWGIKLPFFAQFSNEIHTPQYDPYQLDIELKDRLATAKNKAERDSLRKQAVSINQISGFNFTNVRKEKMNKTSKPMPWDISNFSASYSFIRNKKRTPIIADETLKTYNGSLDYAFNAQPLSIKPFDKLITKGKWLKWIKEINFNPLPNSITVNNELTRRFGSTHYRFTESSSIYYEKRFLWDRIYGLNWDLTKSIRVSFNATNNSVIDETNTAPPNKEEILAGLKKGGRNKLYTHTATASYTVPFKYIPILDWIDVKAQYTTNFGWTAAALNADSLGNVIRNGQKRQINGDFNFVNLYNKLGYLKKINTPPAPTGKDGKGGKDGKEPKGVRGKDGDKDADGKVADADGKDAKDAKDKKKKERQPSIFERALLRPLMILRRARFNYSEDFTTVLPGFVPIHRILGQDMGYNAPGYDFAFGAQPGQSWLDNAGRNGWISSSIYQAQQFTQTHTLNYDGQVQLEPFKDFKIDIDIKKQTTENFSENFKVEDLASAGTFKHLNPMNMGSMTITYLPLKTLYQDGTDSATLRKTFEKFEDYREIISERLGVGTHTNSNDSSNYTYGYGRYQQDVLVSSFLAAYTGRDPKKIFIGDIRKLLPLPNWKLTYNGLSKVKGFDKVFSNISISHGYKSTLTVNSFVTDLDFQNDPVQIDQNTGSFYSRFEVPDFVISEQFSPLIGVDIRLKNELTAKFEMKKGRNLAMNFFDYTLSETRTSDLTFGAGYRIKNFDIVKIFSKKKKKGKKKEEKESKTKKDPLIGLKPVKPQNDLNLKFDMTIRNDLSLNHILDQNVTQKTRGSKTIKISPSIDYIMNNYFTVRLFVDYNRTIPATSIAFPITTIQGGVMLRFTLAQ